MKKFLKFGCGSVIGLFVLLIAIGLIFGDTETTSDEKEEEQSADAKKENSTEPVQTQEQTQSSDAKDTDKLAKEKEFYLNEVKTKIDTQMKMYDAAWSEIWVPTFEGLGSTVDVYTAYDNMKALEQRYNTLYSSFPAIEGDGLSKENQKLLKEFTEGMKNASMWRGEAAEKARKMLDEGDYSPSRMDKMKGDVQYADNQMMQAVVALTTLETALGVSREE